MKIIADENIPLVDHYFGSQGEVILKPGRAISRSDLMDADILLVRSITNVDASLLEKTHIQFVGSTTTGADHLDTAWLNEAGIQWSVAHGCNSVAVAEYVISVIAVLQKMQHLMHPHLRAAVIGVGTIGSLVAYRLTQLGFEVLLCDPFRSEKERDFHGVSLAELTDVDLITVHTPLTYNGLYPTYHLIEKNFLKRQKKNSILLNTSRGAVLHFEDLKRYAEEIILCLDVWENEPLIDEEILEKAAIATPHIAGYSIQSKYRGIEMIYHAAVKCGVIKEKNIPKIEYPNSVLSIQNQTVDWRDVVLSVYNPLETTHLMKQTFKQDKNAFDVLRKKFNERNEFEFVKLQDSESVQDYLNATFISRKEIPQDKSE